MIITVTVYRTIYEVITFDVQDAELLPQDPAERYDELVHEATCYSDWDDAAAAEYEVQEHDEGDGE